MLPPKHDTFVWLGEEESPQPDVTVNVEVHVLELPAASVTVNVMVYGEPAVVTLVPDVGDWVITSEPDVVQLSVAVTPLVKLGTWAEPVPLSDTLWLGAHDDIVGAVTSLTVNVLVQVL